MGPPPIPIVEDEEVAAEGDQVLEEVDQRVAAVHGEEGGGGRPLFYSEGNERIRCRDTVHSMTCLRFVLTVATLFASSVHP
jgi:hypothetical protein